MEVKQQLKLISFTFIYSNCYEKTGRVPGKYFWLI